MKKLIALILLLPSLAWADFSGRVVGISDGDTITVLHGREQVRVRLNGIDTPERGQPYGRKAKLAAGRMAHGKTVKVVTHGTDKYGRTIGTVILPDGRKLNEEMVRRGYAWHYRKYSNSKRLSSIEEKAKADQLGLWKDENAVPPWDWRRGIRTVGATLAPADGYHGNVKSMVFHAPGCQGYRCKNCTAVFRTREEAIEAGFRPCGMCRP